MTGYRLDEFSQTGHPLCRGSLHGFAVTVTTLHAGRPSAEYFDEPPPRQLTIPDGKSWRYWIQIRSLCSRLTTS
ncbi:hypothetical protein NITHO_2170005 [Nitrolancea hollandica Lb]|uniref:Uncharacterized protein n=1 Tax=Nitrolancea hollandica Lb TaxID=1129897 RepID=I4EF15_9BACT|nr:hypothetical protein NITHO_2170005 [Nitrolancea hollandica Lb]